MALRRSGLLRALATCVAAGVVLLTAPLAAASARAHTRPAGESQSPAAAAPDVMCANEQLLGGSYHDVTVIPGTWCLLGFSTLTGSVRATGATSFGMYGSRIAGDVTITGTTSYPDATGEVFGGIADGICFSAIYGNLRITQSSPAARWNIGATNYPPFANFSNCISSIYVGGDVVFDDNEGSPNEIGSSDIEGNLECHGNGAFTDGVVEPYTKNRVDGTSTGQCTQTGMNGDSPQAPPPLARPARSAPNEPINTDCCFQWRAPSHDGATGSTDHTLPFLTRSTDRQRRRLPLADYKRVARAGRFAEPRRCALASGRRGAGSHPNGVMCVTGPERTFVPVACRSNVKSSEW